MTLPSPSQSAREDGVPVRLIVIHTAERTGASYTSLGAVFSQPGCLASSHVGIDDTPGVVGEYVPREMKAWTQGDANPVSVSAELCGFTRWTRAQWLRDHGNMLANCAEWLAEEALAFGLPLVKLTPAQAQSDGRGVCFHSDLGQWGGGHSDPGVGFPVEHVLKMARGVDASHAWIGGGYAGALQERQ